jgi:hypothetical protein
MNHPRGMMNNPRRMMNNPRFPEHHPRSIINHPAFLEHHPPSPEHHPRAIMNNARFMMHHAGFPEHRPRFPEHPDGRETAAPPGLLAGARTYCPKARSRSTPALRESEILMAFGTTGCR